MKSKTPPDIFEASHGTADICNSDWRVIRSMLRILLRQSKNARKSSAIQVALSNITRDEDRDIFIKYFMKGISIAKIALDDYYSIETVKRYLKRGTKEFVTVYCDGILIKPFTE